MVEPGGSGLALLTQHVPSNLMFLVAVYWWRTTHYWTQIGRNMNLGDPSEAAVIRGASIARGAFSRKIMRPNILRGSANGGTPDFPPPPDANGPVGGCAVPAAFRRLVGSGQPGHSRPGDATRSPWRGYDAGVEAECA